MHCPRRPGGVQVRARVARLPAVPMGARMPMVTVRSRLRSPPRVVLAVIAERGAPQQVRHPASIVDRRAGG
jgi:hypothetical protein